MTIELESSFFFFGKNKKFSNVRFGGIFSAFFDRDDLLVNVKDWEFVLYITLSLEMKNVKDWLEYSFFFFGERRKVGKVESSFEVKIFMLYIT